MQAPVHTAESASGPQLTLLGYGDFVVSLTACYMSNSNARNIVKRSTRAVFKMLIGQNSWRYLEIEEETKRYY